MGQDKITTILLLEVRTLRSKKRAKFLDLLASSGWSWTTHGFIGFICSVAVGSSYCDGLCSNYASRVVTVQQLHTQLEREEEEEEGAVRRKKRSGETTETAAITSC